MRKVKSQWVVVGLSAVAVLGVGAGAINFNSDNDENTEINQKVEIPDERTANKTSISDTDGEIIENGQLDDAQEESMVIEIPADSAEAFTSNYPVGTISGVLEAPTSPIPTTTATSNQNSQIVGSIPKPESPVIASPVGTETGTGTGNVEVFPDLEETVQPGGESLPGNTNVSDSKTEELPTGDQEITEQVTTNTIDETVSVPFDTVYVEDESLLVGEEQIVQTGTIGVIVNTYTEVVRDEVQESYSLTNTVVVSNPLNQIVHIGVKELKQETKTISTSYETVYQSDTELEKGQTEVIQIGVMGESIETYNVTYVKGIKVTEELVGTEVVKEPVNQIVAEGTQNIPVVTTKEEEKTIVVPYTTTEVEDASLESGKTEVRQEGVNGERVISEKVTLTDGIETDREVISDTVIVPAVNKVVAVGTKVAEQKTETETENIVAYTTLKQEENSIPMGELQLVQPGLFGYDTVTYEVTYTNGVETGRVETGRVTTVPVDEIVRIGTQVTETKTETIEERIVAFTTVKQEDNGFPIDQTEVIQAGVDGYDTVTYEVTYTNGIETGRTEVNRTTTVPVNEILAVGTKEAPAVTPKTGSILNISLLIDSTARISASDPLNLRVSTAKRFVECLDSDDIMEVVHNDISLVSSEFTNNIDTLNASIEAIKESTAMEDFFASASGLGSVLQRGQLINKEGNKVIVMFTDGLNEDWWATRSFYSLFNDNIDDAIEHTVTVYIIGVGQERNKSFLQSAAMKTGGRYIDVEEINGIESLLLDLSYADGDDGSTADTDHDGLTDAIESAICISPEDKEEIIKTNPTRADTDGDGLSDLEELINKGTYFELISDPTNAYSDGDFLNDYEETVIYKTDPLDPENFLSNKLVALLGNSDGKYLHELIYNNYVHEDGESLSDSVKTVAYQVNLEVTNAIFNYSSVKDIYKDTLMAFLTEINNGKLIEEKIEYFENLSEVLIGLVEAVETEGNQSVLKELVLISKVIDILPTTDLSTLSTLDEKAIELLSKAEEADKATDFLLAFKKAVNDDFEIVADNAKVGELLDMEVVTGIDLSFDYIKEYLKACGSIQSYELMMRNAESNIKLLSRIIVGSDNLDLQMASIEIIQVLQEKIGKTEAVVAEAIDGGAKYTVGTIVEGVISKTPIGAALIAEKGLFDAILNLSEVSESNGSLSALALSAHSVSAAFEKVISCLERDPEGEATDILYKYDNSGVTYKLDETNVKQIASNLAEKMSAAEVLADSRYISDPNSSADTYAALYADAYSKNNEEFNTILQLSNKANDIEELVYQLAFIRSSAEEAFKTAMNALPFVSYPKTYVTVATDLIDTTTNSLNQITSVYQKMS